MLGRCGDTAGGIDRANLRSTRRRFGARSARLLPALLAAALLSGCFSAFEETRGRHSGAVTPERRAGAGEYVVVGGDTLYSIAFRNQIDFHDLASWNRISGPDYRIYPGRVLRLTPAGSQPATAEKRNPPETVASTRLLPGKSAAAVGMSGNPNAAAPAGTPQTQPNVSVPPDSAVPPRLPKAPAASAAAIPGPRFDAGRWGWPTQGRVARGFGADGNKGVDIAGNLGQIVIAAGPGKVVYSGTALKGYGELVILKHDEQYLSAYGFNQRRLVNEGDVVGAGQPIAELGFGPEQKPELHFEIRDRGRPIDPLALLPKR
ncbi:MAG: LysM peptidoglycan-binding protein [Nevskia sp.]|nr:LysM peptidoglycan-binding protein [Nevskia sp.]